VTPDDTRPTRPCAKCQEPVPLDAEAARALLTGKPVIIQHAVCPTAAEAAESQMREFRVDVLVCEQGAGRDVALEAGRVVHEVLLQADSEARSAVDLERVCLEVVTALAQAQLLSTDESSYVARGSASTKSPTFTSAVSSLSGQLAASWDKIIQHASMVDADAGTAL
jgi:hypothetical protein